MAASAAISKPLSAVAQTYPSRPVRIIMPFAPGGPTDVFARIVTQRMSADLGQQFYVENLGGGGGNTGMGNAARAAPDGYTVALVYTSFIVNTSHNPKIPNHT